jgi:hypothetical protein
LLLHELGNPAVCLSLDMPCRIIVGIGGASVVLSHRSPVFDVRVNRTSCGVRVRCFGILADFTKGHGLSIAVAKNLRTVYV